MEDRSKTALPPEFRLGYLCGYAYSQVRPCLEEERLQVLARIEAGLYIVASHHTLFYQGWCTGYSAGNLRLPEEWRELLHPLHTLIEEYGNEWTDEIKTPSGLLLIVDLSLPGTMDDLKTLEYIQTQFPLPANLPGMIDLTENHKITLWLHELTPEQFAWLSSLLSEQEIKVAISISSLPDEWMRSDG